MTPEEIRTKSLELAALYTAKANGKILEYDTKSIGWVDNGSTSGPDMQSDLSRWRVKPEPRRMWQISEVGCSAFFMVQSESEADQWKKAGHQVTEFVEVLQ